MPHDYRRVSFAPVNILPVLAGESDVARLARTLADADVPHVLARPDADARPDLIVADTAAAAAAALADARRRWPAVPVVAVADHPSPAKLAAAVVRAAAQRAVDDRAAFLADAVPHIVFTARPDGTIDYCNARWHQFTGLTLDQARAGGGMAVALHPADVDVARATWAAALAAGQPFEAEYRLRRADGSHRYHLFRGVPRHAAAAGSVDLWVVTATDIDDRRRDEADHRRLLGQLDAILSNMNEGLVVADARGHVLSMNAAGLAIYGLTDVADLRHPMAALVGRIEMATLDGGVLPVDRWPLGRALAGESFTDLRLRLHWLPTGRRWIGSYAGGPIRDDAAVVQMAVVTFRDVTAAVRAEADLAAAQHDAEQARALAVAANQSKDDFLATLSHELRTPLNAILGWTQLLRGDLAEAAAGGGIGPDAIDPDDLQQGLATIDRNARVQAQLIEDLLDVSRIAAGKLRLNRRLADLQQVAAAAVDAVRPAAADKRVALHLTAPAAPLLMSGDPDRLQQVAWNLLTNAIKFTPAGGTVRLAVSPADDDLELTVIDTGQGMAADLLPHVFDRFRQGDSSAVRQHGGLGLGLAIVRQLVEMHGGTVAADSDGPGRGSTFRVTLPRGDVAGLPEPTAPPSPTTGADPQPLAGVAVLVVDDDADARSVVARLLRRAGASVTTVAAAAEAVAVVAADRPAVLVSDVAMAGLDGHGLVAAVRRLPPEAGGRTPAVAVSGLARAEDRDRSMAAGFDVHLPKPIDAAHLVATVAALARRSTASA